MPSDPCNMMDKKTLAIGGLLNSPEADALSKRVLGAYRPSVQHATNVANLKACKAAPVEACAKLLGFKVRDENDKKLYKNLGILCDRIVLKIESLFEITCGECLEEYQNTLEDEPLLQCKICMQGSHNCDKVKRKYEALNSVLTEENSLSGFVWLCHGCLSNNNLSLINDTQDSSGQEISSVDQVINSQSQSNESEGSEIVTGSQNDQGTETYVPPRRRNENSSPQTAPREICELYRKRQCPHGPKGNWEINGAVCEKWHPERCIRYCNYGNAKRVGCRQPQSCGKWHPPLCRYSMRDRICINIDTCVYWHLKYTQRSRELQQPTAGRGNYMRRQIPRTDACKYTPAPESTTCHRK